MKRCLPVAAAAPLSLSLVPPSPAEWHESGLYVSTHDLYVDFGGGVSDGAGGSVVVWSAGATIRAQRLDRFGEPIWADGGIVVCSTAGSRTVNDIAPDGAGGAVISWADYRSGNGDIYVQHVDSAGAPQWSVNGEPLCQASSHQTASRILADGTGAFIVAWEDQRSGTYDIFAQKIDAAGVTQWTFDGRLVCNAPGSQRDVRLAEDGAGGAFFTWWDTRSGGEDVYVQRLNAAGTAQWAANGVVAHTYTASDQSFPSIVPDGAGGAVVAWEDGRVPSEDESGVYAQRFNAAGSRLWNSQGAAVCKEFGNQSEVRLAADGVGGCLVAWTDTRFGQAAVYAERLSAAGIPQWVWGGIAVSSTNSRVLGVAGTGDGGGMVVWADTVADELRAQRLDAGATAMWGPGGVTLARNAKVGSFLDIVNDGTSATLVWDDIRTDDYNYFPRMYAQRVEWTHGQWGNPEPGLMSAADVPNDQGGRVAVTWESSRMDRAYPRTIDQYSVWRATSALGAATPLPPELLARVLDPDAPAPRTEYAWELVGTQTAHGYAAYSLAAPTLADSVPGDDGAAWYRVAAHGAGDDFLTFVSDVMTGYSVDNLAPAAPMALMASRVGSNVELQWNRVPDGDLRDYTVYRATEPGVTPVPIHFLLGEADTTVIDANVPQADLYYIVTASDVHANESLPSNEASVLGPTSVGGLPAITGLMLLPNRPNPFRSRTEFTVGLPEPSDVRIQVFDVTGRLVRALEWPERAPGWAKLTFDGRDAAGGPLGDGLYFYRVTAGRKSATGKMLLTR